MGWADISKAMDGKMPSVGNSPLALRLGDTKELDRLADSLCEAVDEARDANALVKQLKAQLRAKMKSAGLVKLLRSDRGDIKVQTQKTKDTSKKAITAYLGKEKADLLWHQLPDKVRTGLDVPKRHEISIEPGMAEIPDLPFTGYRDSYPRD